MEMVQDPRVFVRHMKEESLQVKNKVINLPEKSFKMGKIVIPKFVHFEPDIEEQGDLVLILKVLKHPKI